MKNPNYKNKDIERKYLNNTWKNQFLKIKNSPLELEKQFIELKDRELKERGVKIERETEELFCKPIIVSIDDIIGLNKKKWRKQCQIKTLGMIG